MCNQSYEYFITQHKISQNEWPIINLHGLNQGCLLSVSIYSKKGKELCGMVKWQTPHMALYTLKPWVNCGTVIAETMLIIICVNFSSCLHSQP